MIGLGIGLGVGMSSGPPSQGGDEVVRKITLFDGQFFRGLCDEYSNIADFKFFENINWDRAKSPAFRAFYYDSLPVQKNRQSDEDYEKERGEKVAELDHIRSQKWMHVRDGISRYRQREKRREQKGVDILLAIDAVQFATQGLADEIEILTSDADFFPVFEAISKTRCRGILRYQHGKASNELIHSADEAKPLELWEIANWCNVGWGSSKSLFPSLETFDRWHDAHIGNASEDANEPIFSYDEKNKIYELLVQVNAGWALHRSPKAELLYACARQFHPDFFTISGPDAHLRSKKVIAD